MIQQIPYFNGTGELIIVFTNESGKLYWEEKALK
jgi:hypothetical protein